MAKYKIKVIAKRRDEVDVDKLAQALLRLVEELQPKAEQEPQAPPVGGEPTDTETAA